MPKTLTPYAILASALIGYIASIAGFLDYAMSLGVCELGGAFSCESVYNIPQARIFGVHLSEAAPVYFTLLALSAIAYAVGYKRAIVAVAALSISALTLIPYLVYLELWVARAICIWCTVMHASIIASSILSAAASRVELGLQRKNP